MLPDDHGVGVEIGDVGSAEPLRVLLQYHPAEVRVEDALVYGVRVPLRVCVPVVRAVQACPPACGTLDGAPGGEGQGDAEGEGCCVGSVGPEAVVAFWLRWVRRGDVRGGYGGGGTDLL